MRTIALTLCILKRVMYVYLLWLTVSNLCALITAVPAFYDGSYGLEGGYITAFYQVIIWSISLTIMPWLRLIWSCP